MCKTSVRMPKMGPGQPSLGVQNKGCWTKAALFMHIYTAALLGIALCYQSDSITSGQHHCRLCRMHKPHACSSACAQMHLHNTLQTVIIIRGRIHLHSHSSSI